MALITSSFPSTSSSGTPDEGSLLGVALREFLEESRNNKKSIESTTLQDLKYDLDKRARIQKKTYESTAQDEQACSNKGHKNSLNCKCLYRHVSCQMSHPFSPCPRGKKLMEGLKLHSPFLTNHVYCCDVAKKSLGTRLKNMVWPVIPDSKEAEKLGKGVSLPDAQSWPHYSEHVTLNDPRGKTDYWNTGSTDLKSYPSCIFNTVSRNTKPSLLNNFGCTPLWK